MSSPVKMKLVLTAVLSFVLGVVACWVVTVFWLQGPRFQVTQDVQVERTTASPLHIPVVGTIRKGAIYRLEGTKGGSEYISLKMMVRRGFIPSERWDVDR